MTEVGPEIKSGIQGNRLPPARGGARPGAGRKPKPKESLLARAYYLLDQAQVPAVQALIDLLQCDKPEVRASAARTILSKRIPDMVADTGQRGDITINVVYGASEQPAVQVFQRTENGHGNGA